MSPQDPLGVNDALARRRQNGTIRQLSRRPAGSIDFSSNDFLSLASSQELREAYLAELNRTARNSLGSGGSRLLDGNSTEAETLEKDLAAFYRAPSGLLCNSGFDANVSVFSCLPQPDDTIIFDELIHASVHDGMRQSRTRARIRFRHNSVGDLQKKLEKLAAENDGVRQGKCNVFVAVEAVYSMDGDVAPIAHIVETLKNFLPAGNGHLIVDEAHSVGVFGPEGRGLVSQLGLEDPVSIRLHTFGKALACSGAVILCSAGIRDYLINYARPLIYTTFMSFPQLTAIQVSHDCLQQGRTEPLVQHLQQLRQELHRGLLAVVDSLPAMYADIARISEVPSPSAISYVMSTRARELAEFCRSQGLWVRAILPPTVPEVTDRVRICLHAGNTTDEVQRLVQSVMDWTKFVQQARL